MSNQSPLKQVPEPSGLMGLLGGASQFLGAAAGPTVSYTHLTLPTSDLV